MTKQSYGHRLRIAVGIAILVGFLAVSSLAMTSGVETPFYVAPAIAACDGHCDPDCTLQGGGQGDHEFHIDPEEEGELQGDEHTCVTQSCTANHSICGLPVTSDAEREQLASRLAEVAAGNVGAAAAVFRDYDGYVRVAEERGVMQVAGTCSPSLIVAQVALNPAQLAAVLPKP